MSSPSSPREDVHEPMERLADWTPAPPDARLFARLKAIPEQEARSVATAEGARSTASAIFGAGLVARRWFVGEAALGLLALLAGFYLGTRTDIRETRLDVASWLAAPVADPLPGNWEDAP